MRGDNGVSDDREVATLAAFNGVSDDREVAVRVD